MRAHFVLGLVAFLLFAVPARADLVDHSDVFEPVFVTGGRGSGPGLAFLDYDGDGDLDLLVTHGADGLRLYANGGPPDFEFSNVSLDAALPEAMGFAFGALAADLDRDQDPDLAIADVREGVRIFENQGGVFAEVTARAGTFGRYYPSSLAAGDLDGDGWIDLWVGTELFFIDEGFQHCGPSRIFHNEGDGTFTSVEDAWGVDDRGCTLAVIASDFDRDHDPDLMSANDFGRFVVPNKLFRNDGPTPEGGIDFHDASAETGFERALCGMGIASADVDANGFPDYFVTNIGRAVLLLGSPDGFFTDAVDSWGVQATFARLGYRATWGAAFLDLEADGFAELAIASAWTGGGVELFDDPIETAIVYGRLDGISRPHDDAIDLGVVANDSSRGLAAGDFDADGDDDFATASEGGLVHLYRNDAAAGPTVSVVLHGTVANPDGLGAWVSLTCDGVNRGRELQTGGSYAASHEARVRIPLAGCPDGGLLRIEWPSSLVETVAVGGGGEVVERIEPAWIEAPAALVADGASQSTIRVVPRGPDGALLGPGQDVDVAATAGTVAPVTDLGDGTYEAVLTAPAAPGTGVLTISLDGRPAFAHPRVRFFAGDRTTLSISPKQFAAGETDVHVAVVPRDAAGALDGPGRSVTLDLVGGTLAGAIMDVGDGRYEAVVHGDGGGDLVVSARVDGVSRGPAESIPEIAGLDPAESFVHLAPVAVARDAIGAIGDPPEMYVRVAPRDGAGIPRTDVVDHDYEVVGALGEIVPTFTGFGGAPADWWSATLLAEDAANGAPLELRVDGVALDHRPEPFLYDDPSEVRDALDVARSRVAAYRESVYADDEDYVWVIVRLVDARGDLLPWVDGFSVASPGLDLVEERIVYASDYKARLRASAPPGTYPVDLEWEGEPIGVSTWVSLVPPLVPDPAALGVRTCSEPTTVPADGESTGRVVVRPHDEDGILVGSNVDLRVTVDGDERALDYAIPGGYVAPTGPEATPTIVWIETELVGTGRTSRTWVDFYDPKKGPTNPGPGCVELGPPVEPDAGPDAGDAGDDAGPDAGEAGDDGGTTDDAGPEPPSLRPRGGGCGCGAAGGAGLGAAWVLAGAVSWRTRARAGRATARRPAPTRRAIR